jgi:hypothetical protein
VERGALGDSAASGDGGQRRSPVLSLDSGRDRRARRSVRRRGPSGRGPSGRGKHPARFEYYLTAAGRDLYPVIVTLMRWGDQYLADDNGPPVVLQHHCGHQLTAQVVCQACGEPLQARHTRPLTDRTPQHHH